MRYPCSRREQTFQLYAKRRKSILKPVIKAHEKFERFSKRKAQKCVSDPGTRYVQKQPTMHFLICLWYWSQFYLNPVTMETHTWEKWEKKQIFKVQFLGYPLVPENRGHLSGVMKNNSQASYRAVSSWTIIVPVMLQKVASVSLQFYKKF